MLRVYFCRMNGAEPSIPEGILSSYREKKLSVQKNALARCQSVFSELLLRHALRENGFMFSGPLDISVAPNGKPFLSGGECHFSLSHSAEAVLCALCDKEIGADVQISSKVQQRLIRRFFAAEEQDYILSSNDADEAFTEVWTKKESWCKRSGLGLSLSLPSFSVFEDRIAATLRHTTTGEYHITICTDAPPERLELINVETSALLP